MSSNPDRWSKASSDSEASFFSLSGDIRLDLPRALDVKELLSEKAAFITGGKDLTGAIYITIPKYEENEDVQLVEHFGLLLNYLASTRSTEEKAHGFSFLVDLRLSTWADMKPVVKVIQDIFAFKVINAYVLKPDGFGGLHRASFSTTKFTFEIILTSSDGLNKYIAPGDLTQDFSGSLHYDHVMWLRMRMAFEKFLFESMALSTKLDDIRRRLLQEDFAPDANGIREQIQQNNHVKKWIVKAPIEILEEEANKVIAIIKESCNCVTEEELSDEGRNAVHQARSMMETLFLQRATLKELWQVRKGRLEQCLQFNVFKQDAETMLAWIQENRAEYLECYSDIGEDLESVKELEEDHKLFEANCAEVQVNIDRVRQVAQRLQDVAFCDVEVIDALVQKLDNEWRKLLMAVERRSGFLVSSRSFHVIADKYMLMSDAWMDRLKETEKAEFGSIEEGEGLLKSHERLKRDMSEAHVIVSEEGKNLLSALQKPTTDDRSAKARSRASDYSEAVSHVMDRILEMHERNRQLTISWEKQRVRLSQRCELSKFQNECNEVLEWIRTVGLQHFKEYTGVGVCYEDAESLFTKHNEFLVSFEVINEKGRKLSDAALQLSEAKECNPEDLNPLASSFENELNDFANRVSGRKEVLEMAKNFFKCADQLSSWVEKLKEELNLDERTSLDCENVDAVLEKHRHQCESTLDQLLNTVREGEELSQKLLCESTFLQQRTSWIEENANNPVNSEKAVKGFLEKLNASKTQLEKLWLGKQQKLDYWIQVKNYERDLNQILKHQLDWLRLWESKELASDFTKAQITLRKFTSESSEMERGMKNVYSRGEHVLHVLQECGVEVSLTDDKGGKVDSIAYMKSTLKSLGDQKSELLASRQKLHKKLQECVQLRRLEADAKRVAGWIRYGENILQASVAAGSSLVEAEALLREYEQFQVAIEKTRLGVMEVRETADGYLRDGHFDYESIATCVSTVEKKWERLMKLAEQRRAVVFTSYNFYRASEQASKLLEKFSKDCRRDEDPCSEFSEYNLSHKQEKIALALSQLDKEKIAVEQSCREVRESSECFLQLVLPKGDGDNTPVLDGQFGRLEILVNDLVEQATSQEIPVLKQLQLRKNVLHGCLEYARFEESAKEALQWIRDHGSDLESKVISLRQEEEDPNGPSSPKRSPSDSSKQTYFKEVFEEIKEKVKLLLNQAQTLIVKTFFHSEGVKECAVSVDTSYRDFICRLCAFRQTIELKLGCSISEIEDDVEWPNISGLQAKANELSSVTRREASSDSGIHELTEEKRRSAKRIEFIMNELLQTERAYCSDLKCCIENFLYPMLDSMDVPDPLIGKHEIIFGNIEEIYEFHNTVFLQALEKYETKPEDVGDCFCDWAEKFQMYVDYCANKPDSNSLLIEHGDNFFEDLQVKRGLALSIAAYLIKPVQRITKYQLLLKELISCCDDPHSTLQAGLDVMLSVPRQANDTMYLCMIEGFNEGSLETLGKILLQDSFVVSDTKNRRKGKERHVFLFEQALLFSKEQKDSYGKVRYFYKSKLKTSELGITEHLAEDPCKFAVWTGEPPFTEDKRTIKAESVIIKQTWVKELRELIQQFRFGILPPRTSFYPTSPRKKKKNSSSSTDTTSLVMSDVRHSADFDSSTISSKSGGTEVLFDLYVLTADYKPHGPSELALDQGQVVEVLAKPAGSKVWRVRRKGDVLQEGLVPYSMLRKYEDGTVNGKPVKRSSVETLNSHSSEESMNQSSDSTSSGRVSPSSRRRSKSVNLGTLKMRTWSKSAGRRLMSAASKSPLPPLPSRTTTTSGGGSKKLQQLLGAPRNDIDLLLRPTGDTIHRSATLDRVPREKRNQSLKKRISLDVEDAGFQEDDYLSEGDSDSDSNESVIPALNGTDAQKSALKKRDFVLKELIQTEQDYIHDLEAVVKEYMPSFASATTPKELRNKERLLFGNIQEIYDFHKSYFLPELEKVGDTAENIGVIVCKAEKKWAMYLTYCQHKPKSMRLLHDHLDSYFEELKTKFGHRLSLNDYLIKPVQRITKYQILIKDCLKYTVRAGIDPKELKRALDIMQNVPKQANDTMHVGMLEGFSGDLNAQGKLIIQESMFVCNAKSRTKPQERRLFLFEQFLVFSEPFERHSDFTVFIYRHGIKLNTLGLTENIDEDPNKFAIWTKNPAGGSELYFLTAKSPNIKKAWVEAIRSILETQLDLVKESNMEPSMTLIKHEHTFNGALQQPIAYQQKTESLERINRSGSPTKLPSGRQHSVEDDRISIKSSNQTEVKSNTLGKVNLGSQLSMKPTSTLKHVKLIPLATAKSLEDLTKAFPMQEKFIVLENYQAQSSEEMTVTKNDVVFFVSKHKKNPQLVNVRSFSRERSGCVPLSILKKMSEGEEVKKIKFGASDSRLRRAASFGHEKTRRERPKRTKSLSTSVTKRKRDTALSRKRDKGTSTDSPSANTLEQLNSKWVANGESSDEDVASSDSESDSLAKIYGRENKTSFEIAPEFKVLPCDVTADAPNNIKITCTLMANPDAEVLWTKNDTVELQSGERYRIFKKGPVCMLEIIRSHPSDSGTYSVSATNSLGSASCCVKVTVRGLARPGSPSKPCITAMTATSVVLAWDPPETLDQIPITAYTIEYKEAIVASWHVAAGVVINTTTIIDDLIPSKTYQFRVSANNEIGISEPSEPSDSITMDLQTESEVLLQPVSWKDNMQMEYNISSELGRGRFSLVKKCVEKATGKEYAAKLVKKRVLDQEMVENEIAILKVLNHPSLCKIHGTYDTPKNLILVLELLSGGRLFDHIVIMDNLTERIAIGFVKQMLQALQYLHECGIAHLDVKPENLILSCGTSPRLKLIDFGDAVRITEAPYIHEINGSPEFNAPEVINGEPVSLGTDLWSVGVIIYVLLSGVSPFYSDNYERSCQNITEIRYRFPHEFFSGVSTEATDLIEELLIHDQSHRPDAKECLRLPWIRMTEPGFKPQALNKRISLSRLAAFNARRRYQNEMVTSSISSEGSVSTSVSTGSHKMRTSAS
ncbi:triple functional domain protein-like isoform X2 [Rhopilema esculentum]|uniref:triple functional domain protein-like isoform X2 n=1 Tax=Rhopilema esculentum TaxID=499914 RepID=UPI0031E472FA